MAQGNQGSNQEGSSNRGFAGMDPKKQQEISSKGGQAAHESGNAHEFTSEEAREAGRKGGEAVSQDREHMSEIGRKGGEASHGGGRSNTGNQVGSQGGSDRGFGAMNEEEQRDISRKGGESSGGGR
jgi:general stress protein YciG